MAKVHICDYLGFAIEVDSETGMFYEPSMQLERTSMAPLKAAIREESKARGLFKPFILVEREDPGKIFAKCVNKDEKGYRLANGSYIRSYSLGDFVVVPESYEQDIAEKLKAWRAAEIARSEAVKKARRLCLAVTEGYPLLKDYAP